MFFVDGSCYYFIHQNCAFCHFTHVCCFAADNFHTVCDFNQTVCCFDHTMVTHLTAAFCVERCFIQEHCHAVASLCACCHFVICYQSDHFRIGNFCHIIACKYSCQICRQFVIYSFSSAHVVGFASCCSCTVFLCFHFSRKCIFVNAHACFFQNFFCQIDRETVGVIQTEGFFAAHHCLTGSFHFFHILFQDFHTIVDGFIEGVFFQRQDLEDVFLFVNQFGVSFTAASDHGFGQFRQEFALNTQQFAVTSRSSQQSSQHVAAAFVGRQNTVCCHHGYGTDVVCDDTNGNVHFAAFAVFYAGFCTYCVADGFYSIYVKDRVYALHDGCHTFQTHTCIYVFEFQFGICAVFVGIELCQNQIPEFHISVTVTAYAASRAVAAVFGTAIIVDFCTGTAGACAVFPEVVGFAQFYDSVCRQTNFFFPDFACFVIFFIDGYVQSVCRDFQPFCYEFPGPGNDFVFEVITEGEVAQHFEECAVTCCFPYVVDIACTDTFLACGHSFAGGDFLTCEVCLHRSHTRVDQQQAVIVLGHQREGFQTQVVFCFKEFQKLFSDFVYTKVFHGLYSSL